MNNGFHQQYHGGLSAQSIRGPGIYYVGIIDILQKWNASKKIERAFKRFVRFQDAEGISCLPPIPYAERFMSMLLRRVGVTLSSIIQDPDCKSDAVRIGIMGQRSGDISNDSLIGNRYSRSRGRSKHQEKVRRYTSSIEYLVRFRYRISPRNSTQPPVYLVIEKWEPRSMFKSRQQKQLLRSFNASQASQFRNIRCSFVPSFTQISEKLSFRSSYPHATKAYDSPLSRPYKKISD